MHEAENSSFIYTVYVKYIIFCNFKLVCVVLHLAFKEFSETTSKNGEIGCFNLSLLKESF